MVNYVYGPTTRAGLLKTISSRQALQEAVRYTVTTCGLWGVARLFVLTLVVGVHVVELVCIWVAMFMWIVWTPAIMDVCATDYMAVLSMMTCYLVHQMELMSAWGAARMCGMMMLWWLNGSLVYNVVVNMSRSRYVGLVVMTCVLLWVIAPGVESSVTHAPLPHAHSRSHPDETHRTHIPGVSERAVRRNDGRASGVCDSGEVCANMPVPPSVQAAAAVVREDAEKMARTYYTSARRVGDEVNGDDENDAMRQRIVEEVVEEEVQAMAKEDVLLSSRSRLANALARVQRSFATCLVQGEGSNEMGIVDGVVRHYLSFLAQVAEYEALTPSPTIFFACCNDDGKEAYKVVITAGLLLAASLVGVNIIVGYQQTAEVKARMRRSGIVLVNHSVLLRKIVRTVVNLICVASFLLTWWLSEVFVLPRAASWLPLPAVIAKGFSVVAACVVIGGVTDMNESIYDLVMRLFGVLNPPSRKSVVMSNDDSAEDELRTEESNTSFTK